MQLPSAGRSSSRALARLADVLPFFVLGWREVFVPLAVVMHNDHGPTLAVAGLAVAASRLGGWLHARGLFRRPPQEAAILGGLALLLLGLAPEEGPVGLLLWFVFGATWPILHEALDTHLRQGRMSQAALLTGMVVAGPLANGPGTWLIAGVYFYLGRYVGMAQEKGCPSRPDSPAVGEPSTIQPGIYPFLFGFVSLAWIWLVPARLVDLSIAPAWFGVSVAASWAARFAGAWLAQRLPIVASQGLGGIGLVAGIALVATAQAPWQLASGLILAGAGLGIFGARPGIARTELGDLPGRSQALGEVLGPIGGVVVYLLGGSLALFVAAAVASLALPIARRFEPNPNSLSD